MLIDMIVFRAAMTRPGDLRSPPAGTQSLHDIDHDRLTARELERLREASTKTR